MGMDPRCTCDGPLCPICRGRPDPDLRSAQPWTPRAGVPAPPPDIAAMMAEDAEERAAVYARWERWQAIRRYLLVLLLALIGGIIGGVSGALALLYTFN